MGGYNYIVSVTCCKLLWLRCDRPFYTFYSSTAILVPGAGAVQVASAVDSVNCKVGGVFLVTFQLLLHCSVHVPRANLTHIYVTVLEKRDHLATKIIFGLCIPSERRHCEL